MENANQLESGFQIKNLILTESSFSRINQVSFDEDVKDDLNINVNVSVNEKEIIVSEEVIFGRQFQDIEQFKIKVKMIGIFEYIGDFSTLDSDEFGRINGAAIIFPFIREHISSISLKAGIGVVLLLPINFTKMGKK